jgi:hypothetical protein
VILAQYLLFFLSAVIDREAFRRTSGPAGAAKERKIAALEEKLTRKNGVIAELMEDNVQAKKAPGGL